MLSDMELTPKQRAVMDLLVRAARRGHPAPTFREMCAALQVDVRAAYQHVQALEKKGIVRRLGGRRGIELTPEFRPPVGVPVIGRVAAGLPITAEENIEGHVDLQGPDIQEDSFLLKVRGDSMVDRKIFDGDMVLVQPQARVEPGEVAVVIVNGEATVKEVHVQRDGVVLVSHNRAKQYPDQVYGRADDVRIAGKVIMAFRFIK
jgi:repressor LexA